VVLDLIASQHRAFAPFPVGRLDKDTTGLLLLTNDGPLNHQLISPRWHINKIYIARLRDPALDSYHRRFEQGVVIDDGYRCLPARMEVLAEDARLVRLTIQEGQEIVRQLRGRLTGIAQPTYVLDIPGGAGKVPLPPEFWDAERGQVRDWQGRRHVYPPK